MQETVDRDDRPAKDAFCAHLLAQGFERAEIVGSPADILAFKDGVRWRFEVKYTKKSTSCFRAATLTEWVAAAEDPDHFRFVVAYRSCEKWRFDSYTPEHFMEFSYVPPFKVYFTVPLNEGTPRPRTSKTRRIYMTKRRLQALTEQFQALRTLEET